MRRFLPNNFFYYSLFIAAAAFVVGSLWYSNQLVQNLADKEERLVEFWAKVIEHVANPEESETTFLYTEFLQKKIIPVPAILTDEDGNVLTVNLTLDGNLSDEQQQALIQKELMAMQADSSIAPIKIEYYPGLFQYIYYRETDELKQLRMYPYITFLILSVFIALLFANFIIAQRSQQNKLWVGLAKETAHQLGTPISGMMAWTELLREKLRPADAYIIDELENDVERLQVIAQRFSKIGSEPELSEEPIADLIGETVRYMQVRASSKVKIELTSHLPDGFRAKVNPTLFAWVLENLLKNGVDALSGGAGSIHVETDMRNGQLVIDVTDTGKGIPRRNINRIFRPGFTTKKRGWGLGLSLTKRIVEQYHKGHIFVKHTELKKGTTFRVTLPINISA